jgi:hypothetical protein
MLLIAIGTFLDEGQALQPIWEISNAALHKGTFDGLCSLIASE